MKTYEIQIRMIVTFEHDVTKLGACVEVDNTLTGALKADVRECKVVAEYDTAGNVVTSSHAQPL